MDALERLTKLLAENPLAAVVAVSFLAILYLHRSNTALQDRLLTAMDANGARLALAAEVIKKCTEVLEHVPVRRKRTETE